MFPLELIPATPAYVYDETWIIQTAELLQPVRAIGLHPLYSIKALPWIPVMELLEPYLDGFSVSSPFEARLAGTVGGRYRHITSPGLRGEDLAEIGATCSHVSFNSLSQFHRLHGLLPETVNFGIRVNPEVSLVHDERYDPCRPHSKLGVSMDELLAAWADDRRLRQQITGLHFHNAYGRRDFAAMNRTLAHILAHLQPLLPSLHWLNLGGGYLFSEPADLAPLAEIAERLVRQYGLEVFFEPGNGLVGAAGYLVASVIDEFSRGGQRLAVLDTTVNHHPEVFEYQSRLELTPTEAETGLPYLLAGCSCLAGDLFGEYRFAQPLAIGDRVAFRNVGAYSLIKANRFNGHNLPIVVAWNGSEARTLKSFTFEAYRQQWSADSGEPQDYHCS